MRPLFVCACLTVGIGTPLALAPAHQPPPALVRAKSEFGVSLAMRNLRRKYRSGGEIPVTVSLADHGKLPVTFLQRYPARFTFLFRGVRASNGMPATPTAFGIVHAKPCNGVLDTVTLDIAVCQPGGVAEYRNWNGLAGIAIGRYVDLTVPGSYLVRVLTKYHPHESRSCWVYVPSGPNRVRLSKLGEHVAILQDVGGRGRVPPGGGIRSKWIRIRILPPYRKPPNAALIPAKTKIPKCTAALRPGVHLKLVEAAAKGAAPFSAHLLLFYEGHKRLTLRLAGNPQLDFRAVQVHEPGWYVRGIRVQLPKPHWVYPRLPPPLTAYGRWLLKYPPKKMPEKSYKLKPGVVYKYAVPINLSCQYDMSQYGTYRVRVELAHPKIWSNWIKVKVPQ